MNSTLFSREMLQHRIFRVAAATLAVSVLALGGSAVSALRIAPVDAAPPPPAIADSALRFPLSGSAADIATAVASDPFTDDRRAPPRRYRLPGEPDFARAEPAPLPQVLGTAVAGPTESFATFLLPGGQPTVARVGAKVGEYTVVSIERGRVVFRGADGQRFSVDASKPVP